MIVVVNRLTCRDAAVAAHVEARFRDRLKAVDDRPGFLSFELWRDAENPLVLSSVTRWESRAAFDAWTASPEFQAAHAKHAKAHTGKEGEGGLRSEVSVYEVADSAANPS